MAHPSPVPVRAPLRALRLPALLAAVLAVVVSGCGGARPRAAFEAPLISLRSVELRRIDLTGVTVGVTLAIRNPNAVSAALDGLALDLDVDQRVLASLDSPRRVEIPGGQTRDVSLDLAVGFAGVAGLVQQVRAGAVKSARLKGTASFDSPLGRHDVPVDVTGRFR